MPVLSSPRGNHQRDCFNIIGVFCAFGHSHEVWFLKAAEKHGIVLEGNDRSTGECSMTKDLLQGLNHSSHTRADKGIGRVVWFGVYRLSGKNASLSTDRGDIRRQIREYLCAAQIGRQGGFVRAVLRGYLCQQCPLLMGNRPIRWVVANAAGGRSGNCLRREVTSR